MQGVNVTRMELLARKKQIELAQHGLELLKQKRAALWRELMRVADRVLVRSEVLQTAAAAARQALAQAEAVAGPAAVRSAAIATRGEIALDIKTINVMGVQVPVIEQRQVSRSILGRGYALHGTSLTIDEAATAFEVEITRLVELAQSELRLKRLAGEIQRTTRRVNALEHVLIPRLQSERDWIAMALDERERADHFRLKLVKKAHQKSRSLPAPS